MKYQRPRSVRLASFFLSVGLVVTAFVPLPYLTYAPGPTYDTLGEVDSKLLVSISGVNTYASNGELRMTTISEFGGPQEGVYLLDAIRAWFDPAITVVPKESVYPDSVTNEQVAQEAAEAFSLSQNEAIGAALNYLKIPVEEYVIAQTIVKGSPSDGNVSAGSRIVAVDGVPIETPKQVVDAVRAKPVGSTITFALEKDGVASTKILTSAANPHDSKVGFVGMSVALQYVPPFSIKFQLDQVGGPSAGTMFALSIVERLTPGDMTGGKKIAGTGTIDGAGDVGAIGGIAQKMIGAKRAGAQLFLAPDANCADVVGNEPQGLIVAKVSTLSQAVDVVTRFGNGETQFATCN